MELYRPSEHEPLADATWDEERARRGIAEIVADAERLDWPVHPQDEDGWVPVDAVSLYLGAAGMAWALHRLDSRLDVRPLVDRALEWWAQSDESDPGLLAGETGLLLVAHVLGCATADDDRLRACIRANARNETWELLWGSPGTMLAARAIGDDDGWRESAELLWAEWDAGTGFWTQHINGRARQIVGVAHGFAGNVHALRGLRPDDELRARVAPALESTALRDDGLANWPPVAGPAEPDKIRVQWCHGAPGIVAAIGDLMPEELALAGGELTWRAGPIARGPGLCHGTAGNGYAFLKLHALTGDELWLERARRFAMHALLQVERGRSQVGHGRYSLFTGDVGAALYVRSCLDADPRFPVLDVL
jgi:Lanthionine synthetase C-like protein